MTRRNRDKALLPPSQSRQQKKVVSHESVIATNVPEFYPTRSISSVVASDHLFHLRLPKMEDMLNLPNDARSKEVVRLWRAWRTVHEMVADRVRIRHPSLP